MKVAYLSASIATSSAYFVSNTDMMSATSADAGIVTPGSTTVAPLALPAVTCGALAVSSQSAVALASFVSNEATLALA